MKPRLTPGSRSARNSMRVALAAALLLLGLPPLVLHPTAEAPTPEIPEALVATPSNVELAMARWEEDYLARGGDRHLVLPLGWAEGLSAEPSRARGEATFDLVAGRVTVVVEGLEDSGLGDVWLVDDQPLPGNRLGADAGDRLVKLGTLGRHGGRATLTAELGADFFDHFEPDLVAVTRTGVSPVDAGVLYGKPGLFQRLHHKKRLLRTAAAPDSVRGLASLLSPRPAFAQVGGTGTIDDLIARGADLFFNETFNGNGRTCGTCHPAENNFTVDPKFISRLPNTDPLFVAEFNPQLVELEKPLLMRGLGLILENVDGLEDPTEKFAMRGVPHTLALDTSLTPGPNCIGKAEATGWSCDGAPNAGALNDFATGAVIQHFPRTLARQAPFDFRLPTQDELDAMEAFQRSLGRSTDPNLAQLTFNDPVVAAGQALFMAPASRCNTCHFNAGAAIATGQNFNFDTGVERQLAHPADFIDPLNNRDDGGFGAGELDTNPCIFDPGTPNERVNGIGDCRFNTAPLVEAADTPPFFHNNSVATLESAVAFYTSEAFASSAVGGGGIDLDASQIDAIAAFLRVLNSIENIRGVLVGGGRVMATTTVAAGQAETLLLIEETRDAYQVLDERGLHLDEVFALKKAELLLQQSLSATTVIDRNDLVKRALDLATAARTAMSPGPFWT